MKAHTAWLIFAVIAVVYGAMVFSSERTTPANAVSRSHQVIYKVTTSRDRGNCYGFDTTYEMQSGTAQKAVSICDGKTSTVVDQRTGQTGDFVYLSVQNDEMWAKISCEIHVSGKLLYKTYSEGQFVIASCSGLLP